MISLGTDDSMEVNDIIVNYSEYSDHQIPHIIQVKIGKKRVYIYIVTKYIPQNTNWDCGLACVAMTLKGLGFNCSLEDMARKCPVNSVWTIDLAFVLRNYVQDFTYYTSYLGSRKEHQDQKFYQDNFDEDEKRVNKLFAIAKSCSVHVVRM
jgi:hypothetical protein